MTLMNVKARFPLDGFQDTCPGIGRDAHGSNDFLFLDSGGYCAGCLNEEAARLAVGRATRQECPGGCRDHTHGTRYYDCLCCYGD